MYNYRDSKSNIINILKSQTPIEKKNVIPVDSAFTYENGILTWVASIFVDIENSTKLFNTKNEKLARLMRAFTSEIICIFQDIKNYNQIGIRGDCVYSIYDIKTTNDLIGVFKIADKLSLNLLSSILFHSVINPVIEIVLNDIAMIKINSAINFMCINPFSIFFISI